jgi:hypothetical protein
MEVAGSLGRPAGTPGSEWTGARLARPGAQSRAHSGELPGSWSAGELLTPERFPAAFWPPVILDASKTQKFPPFRN